MSQIEHAISLFNEALAARECGEIALATKKGAESLALFEALEGDSPDTANILLTLGELQQAQGDYDSARHSATRAEKILEDLQDTFNGPIALRLRVQALGQLGTILRHQGLYNEAECFLREAVVLASESIGKADEATVMAKNCLGMLYKYTGKFDEAEKLYNEALESLEDHESPVAAMLYHNLGGLEHARGNYKTGEPQARRAWELNGRHFGESHPTTLADAAAWAGLLDGLERYDESEPIYRRVLATFEALYGPEHYEVVVALNNLANVRYAQGDLAEAESLMRRALVAKETSLGVEHPDTALTASNLGVILQSRGQEQADEARTLFTRALAIFRKTVGEDHPKTQLVRENLAGLT